MTTNHKPLIVMALESEGQKKLEALGFDVLYCGVGKVNAAYHLTRKLHQARNTGIEYDYVLNLGTAGSPRFASGALVETDRFMQRDMDVSGLGFPIGTTPFDDTAPLIQFPRRFAHLPSGICGSGDSFLQGPCPVSSDVIDMEAYALAKICLAEAINFSSVKYITDGADGNASNDWQENLKHAAEAFSQLLKPKVFA